MKSYLLDTHILLWWLADNKELTQPMREIIAKPTNRIIVSTVSIWEIIIKKSLGKLEAPHNLKEVINENDFEILPIYADHALYLEQLPSIHNDPFDRLLIAQSIVEDVPLITANTIIPKYNLTCI